MASSLIVTHDAFPWRNEGRLDTECHVVELVLSTPQPHPTLVVVPGRPIAFGAWKLQVVHMNDDAVLVHDDDVGLDAPCQPLPAVLGYDLAYQVRVEILPVSSSRVSLETWMEKEAFR